MTLKDVIRNHVIATCVELEGNVPAAAKTLGISEGGLYHRLKTYRADGWIGLRCTLGARKRGRPRKSCSTSHTS